MTVTVLQRKASMQQIGLPIILLVPAIKGAVYINTHSNYSQPELTKLYNENIGGHPNYTFAALDVKRPARAGGGRPGWAKRNVL